MVGRIPACITFGRKVFKNSSKVIALGSYADQSPIRQSSAYSLQGHKGNVEMPSSVFPIAHPSFQSPQTSLRSATFLTKYWYLRSPVNRMTDSISCLESFTLHLPLVSGPIRSFPVFCSATIILVLGSMILDILQSRRRVCVGVAFGSFAPPRMRKFLAWWNSHRGSAAEGTASRSARVKCRRRQLISPSGCVAGPIEAAYIHDIVEEIRGQKGATPQKEGS